MICETIFVSRESSEADDFFEPGAGLGQVVQEYVWLVRFEFVCGKHACCHGDDFGTDGSSAANIGGCVSDDPDSIGRDARVSQLHFLQCIPGNIVAVQMIVTEATKRKMVIQTIVGEFELSPLCEVSREKSELDVVATMQLLEQRGDAGQDDTGPSLQGVRQQAEIRLEIS